MIDDAEPELVGLRRSTWRVGYKGPGFEQTGDGTTRERDQPQTIGTSLTPTLCQNLLTEPFYERQDVLRRRV